MMSRFYATSVAMLMLFACADFAAVPKKLTKITDEFFSDEKICPDFKPFVNSSAYLNQCRIPSLDPSTEMTKKNSEAFLCYGIFDAIYRICRQNIIAEKLKGKDLEILVNESETRVTKQDMDSGSFCKEMEPKPINETHPKTAHFVAQLNKDLNETNMCMFLCKEALDKPSSLCVVLHWMYKLLGSSSNSLTMETAVVTTKKTEKNEELNPGKIDKKEPKEEPEENVPEVQVKDVQKQSEQVVEAPNVEQNNAEVAEEKSQPETVKLPETKLKPSEESNVAVQETPLKAKEEKKVEEKSETQNGEEVPKEENILDEQGEDEDKDGQNPGPSPQEYDSSGLLNEPEKNRNNGLPYSQNMHNRRSDEDESHMFLYFTLLSVCSFVLYIVYLSKQKILATFAKVRRSRNRNRRRPSTANYRKLDCTLEEAVTSQCSTNVTHVIY